MSFKRDVMNKLEILTLEQSKHNTILDLNTKILDEHQRRSTNLEARILPLENQSVFINKLAKVTLSTAALVAALASAYHYLFMK